jgi:hypothetical protein
VPFDKEMIGIGGQTLRERLIMNKSLDRIPQGFSAPRFYQRRGVLPGITARTSPNTNASKCDATTTASGFSVDCTSEFHAI